MKKQELSNIIHKIIFKSISHKELNKYINLKKTKIFEALLKSTKITEEDKQKVLKKINNHKKDIIQKNSSIISNYKQIFLSNKMNKKDVGFILNTFNDGVDNKRKKIAINMVLHLIKQGYKFSLDELLKMKNIDNQMILKYKSKRVLEIRKEEGKH